MNSNNASVNETFKSADPKHPVDLYVSASLDLTGLTTGTYYFNIKNNFDYVKTKSRNTLIAIDDTCILSEVLVYTDPKIEQLCSSETITMKIGGSLGPEQYVNNPVAVPWAAPSGKVPPVPPSWSWDNLSVDDVNKGVVNYFGHEGGHFPYYYDLNGNPDKSDLYRYLALEISSDSQVCPSVERSLDFKTKRQLLRRQNRMNNRVVLPTQEPLFVSGKITVTLKLYPKFQ